MELLVARPLGTITFCNPENCVEESALDVAGSVGTLAISGGKIAIGSSIGLQVWNRTDHSFVDLEKGPSRWRLYFSNQGTKLLVIDTFERLKCWDLAESKCLWKGRTGGIHCLQWNSDDSEIISLGEGTTVATGACAMLISVWDASTGQRRTFDTIDNDLGCTLNGYGTMSNSLATAVLADGSVKIYDIHARTRIHKVFVQDERICETSFSPRATILACAFSSFTSGFRTGFIRMYNVSDWNLLSCIETGAVRLSTPSLQLTFDATENYLAFVSGENVGTLCDIRTSEIKYLDGPVSTIVFSPPQVVLM